MYFNNLYTDMRTTYVDSILYSFSRILTEKIIFCSFIDGKKNEI